MTNDKIQLQQDDDDDDELLESLKRATVMIIQLDEKVRELRNENRRLIETIIKLKIEVDRLSSDTNDTHSSLPSENLH